MGKLKLPWTSWNYREQIEIAVNKLKLLWHFWATEKMWLIEYWKVTKYQDFYHCGRWLHHHNSRGFHVRLCKVKQSSTATTYYFEAWSKGFATLRNVSKLPFFDKVGHARSVGFLFYWAIWRNESRISSRYLEITSTFTGFEPTHLWDPSDQRRLWVEGLADCATATQGSSAYEK